MTQNAEEALAILAGTRASIGVLLELKAGNHATLILLNRICYAVQLAMLPDQEESNVPAQEPADAEATAG